MAVESSLWSKLRHRRFHLPRSAASALFTPRPAPLRISVAESSHDELGEVADRPALAAGTPAVEAVLVDQVIQKRTDDNRIGGHGSSIIARQAQAVSLE